jgi:hypothetical protein
MWLSFSLNRVSRTTRYSYHVFKTKANRQYVQMVGHLGELRATCQGGDQMRYTHRSVSPCAMMKNHELSDRSQLPS